MSRTDLVVGQSLWDFARRQYLRSGTLALPLALALFHCGVSPESATDQRALPNGPESPGPGEELEPSTPDERDPSNPEKHPEPGIPISFDGGTPPADSGGADSSFPTSDPAVTELRAGAKARVATGALNLRSAANTSAEILSAMECGTEVSLLADAGSGWWRVQVGSTTGYCSGKYLAPSSTWNPQVCTGSPADAGNVTPADGGALEGEVFRLAKSAVGYSYYWGHGSWRADGTQLGSCSGSCPSCTHSGKYGADCSGFVAKVWQIPSASPIDTDAHPYSTYSFVHSQSHWKNVSRADVKPGDAFVYNENGAGHIFLYESGADPWGSVWAYEARGCSTGIVHNLRKADAKYQVIRRDGM